MDSDQEQALVERAKQYPGAFAELYDMYFPRLYAYIRARVDQQQDAEDIGSETFVRALSGLSRFQWRHNMSFASWIFRIAHNLVSDFHRNKRRIGQTPSFEVVSQIKSSGCTPDEVLEAKEVEYRLYCRLAMLSPRRREVIALKFFGELRNIEIANILDLDERTVATHLGRGIADLRRQYQEETAKSDSGDLS